MRLNNNGGHRASGIDLGFNDPYQCWRAMSSLGYTSSRGTNHDYRSDGRKFEPRTFGSLRSTFSNIPRRTKTLVTRCSQGLYEGSKRGLTPPVEDARGLLVRRIETAQTFLTAFEVDSLIGDYLTGVSVQELAKRYGIHRATVFSHLRRRSTPRRSLGLDVDDSAEAVRLFRAGVSMRAISRRLGVGRKAVRTALVQASVVAPS